MWATPQADPRFKQVVFTGLLCYADSKIAIQTPAVNEAFVTSVTGLIKRVAGMQQARKVPSAVECRYCDITHLHCPDRQAGDEQVEGETDDF